MKKIDWFEIAAGGALLMLAVLAAGLGILYPLMKLEIIAKETARLILGIPLGIIAGSFLIGIPIGLTIEGVKLIKGGLKGGGNI